jgi:transmembrane protein 70
MEALLRAGCRQSYSRAVDRSSTIIGTALQQQRWASGGTGKEKGWKLKQRPFSSVEKAVKDKKPVDVVYEGAMADTLRRVKVLSITTCCLSVAGGPLVTFFTSPDLSVIAKGAVASMMVMLSASTTAALHWFASPYVRKLTWTPGSNEMEVEVLSWIATPLRRTIKLSDVKTPMTQRPVVTFAANGNFYYVDKDNFPNAELLKKLAKK